MRQRDLARRRSCPTRSMPVSTGGALDLAAAVTYLRTHANLALSEPAP